MSSRFKESLGFLKNMRNEVLFHSKNENYFCEKYVENPTFDYDLGLLTDYDKFVLSNPFLPYPQVSGFYRDLYASFNFVYEIEDVLDQTEYNGISLACTKTLLELCYMLKVTSTNALIELDDNCSFVKKYSLAQDIFTMAKEMNDSMLIVHSALEKSVSNEETITVTSYDTIYTRFCCKYIRNGIAVLKLFHVLALLQISPAYTDEVHVIAKKLIELLREVLYNKRVIRLLVDPDLYGNNPKAHKSTRLKIYFAMGNSDRYCIRLDFPHQGEESIHLNINEPARKQSTGFPFDRKWYEEVFRICGDKTTFDSLFYYRDDLFWFRSDYTVRIRDIGKSNKEKEKALEQFQHDRAHIEVLSSSKDNMAAVPCFSEAFAEAIADYEAICVYGKTDSDDEELYKYILFQDFFFEKIIKLRSYEAGIRLTYNNFQLNGRLSEIESAIKPLFCKYLKEQFPFDEELNNCVNQQMKLCELFSQCLDCLEEKGF